MSAAAVSFPDLLPPQFVLRVSKRHSQKDPHSGFILVSASPVPEKSNAMRLTPAPMAPITPPYKLHVSTNNMILGGVANTWQHHRLLDRITETPRLIGLTLSAAYRVETPTGAQLSVYDFDHPGITHFLPPHTSRNIPITAVPDYTHASVLASPVTVPKPTVTTGSPAAAPGLPAPTVQKIIDAALKHLPSSTGDSAIALVTDAVTPAGSAEKATAPPKKPRKQAAPQPLPPTTVSAHVARQLFELACIRHTECPIIAEELSEGNTAVMPCGHLFSRLGIEESFKKERNRCPACRTEGRPSFV
jgi:hypothetical protein